MPRKPKVYFETKIKVVEMYLNGEKGPATIYKMIRIGKTTFYNWVYKYQKYGTKGLKTLSKNTEEISEKEKLELEIKLLKSQNKRLEMENAF